MKAVLKLIAYCASLLFSQMTLALTGVHNESTAAFLSVADIHFNPFASCPLATFKPCALIKQLRQAPVSDWEFLFDKYDSKDIAGYAHDTNYALFKFSLQEIKTINQHEKPRFTLILGDFLAHTFREQYILYSHDRTVAGYQEFVKKTLAFMTNEIRAAIPQGDIYPAIGNNDSYTGDYSVVPNGAFLRDTALTWSSLLQDKNNQQAMLSAFPKGGYYAIRLADNPKERILVLNTVLFSESAKGAEVEQAAREELSWLHTQLAEASERKETVLLAFHIPVGINVYKTLTSWFGGLKEFWRSEYSMAFDKEIRTYSDTVRAILPGHIHMDSFQVVGLNYLSNIPVSFTPSISPIFGNNPGFKLYNYDPLTFKLVNYDMYFYSLDEDLSRRHWQKEYNFKQVDQSTCHACSLKRAASK